MQDLEAQGMDLSEVGWEAGRAGISLQLKGILLAGAGSSNSRAGVGWGDQSGGCHGHPGIAGERLLCHSEGSDGSGGFLSNQALKPDTDIRPLRKCQKGVSPFFVRRLPLLRSLLFPEFACSS